MKNKKIRAAALALALLMLAPAALTACKPAPGTEDPTDSQDSLTESLPIETETSEPDAFENTLLLAADGQTAYTVVVPDYAAAWELDAAERLVKTLADLGVTVTPTVDTAAEASAREIVVGYTNRNSELADDFYAVGVAGYHIAAIGENYFVNVVAVVLTDLTFTDAFELAVEEKMIAEQAKLKAEYDNQTKVAQAQAEADAKLAAATAEIEIAQAQADAELKKAQAKVEIAKAEAEAAAKEAK